MEMLRYADELRKPQDYFDDVPTLKPDKEMVDLAVLLITERARRSSPRSLRTTARRHCASLSKKSAKATRSPPAKSRGPKAATLLISWRR